MCKELKLTTIALTITAILLVSGCASAIATTPTVDASDAPSFGYVHDFSEPKSPEGAVRIMQEMEARQTAEAAAEEEAAAELETYYEEDYTWVENYEPSYSGDGFMQEGVREYEGRTESWYSSNQLYHYRTSEWTVDDEGYYRDDQGRYVVAASDVPEGSEIETSKGTGIVLDSGCDEGVTDFYTNF